VDAPPAVSLLSPGGVLALRPRGDAAFALILVWAFIGIVAARGADVPVVTGAATLDPLGVTSLGIRPDSFQVAAAVLQVPAAILTFKIIRRPCGRELAVVAITTAVGSKPRKLVLADINVDGRLNIVTGGEGDGTISVAYNSCTGTCG
jgi:hypothetical protein